MARGDSISVSHVDLPQNVTLAVQPASGDEWLIRLFTAHTAGQLEIHGYDGSNQTDFGGVPQGGNTSVTEVMNTAWSGRVVWFSFTNAEYFLFEENNSADTEGAYFGIKTKD